MDTERFKFGENWLNYAKTLDHEKYVAAEMSLKNMLGTESLENKSFLDIGSGSGLFSLAAHRLGASPLVSFDYDENSVKSTTQLRNQYANETTPWTVSQGDVLNKEWLATLGQFDIVYSWGVLHHTGSMWRALENVSDLVRPGGTLFISIYNDQGWISRFWHRVKRRYNRDGRFARTALVVGYLGYFIAARTVRGILRLQMPNKWYQPSGRGMNIWHDAVDWVGGYPFETSTAGALEEFFVEHGFYLQRSNLKTGAGCNELVLTRS